METKSIPRGGPRVAAYLRCHPYDEGQMAAHSKALHHYAEQLGLADPLVFMDNGGPSQGPLPALARLVRELKSGAYSTVLVPGAFVFSLRENEAHAVVRWISMLGCRVFQMPSPRSAVSGGEIRADRF